MTSAPEYWLDIGAGIEAAHWCALPAPALVRRVALDPLLTTGMIASDRLPRVPADVLRVGGEVRPHGSLEGGQPRSHLPFRDRAFHYVHCGFVLHLYLDSCDVIVAEAHRVLRPGGRFDVLIPHFGDARSEGILAQTERCMRKHFGVVEVEPFGGPYTTFWADLYRDRTIRLYCQRK